MSKTGITAYLVIPILATLFLLAPARTALGQSADTSGGEDFRRHFDEGQRLYLARQVEDALREFDAAYAIRPEPRVLCARGNALAYLKRSAEALATYERCLKDAQDLSAEEQEQVRGAMKRVTPVPPPDPVPPPPKQEPVQLVDYKAPQARQPVYKKWWFWTTVGGVVAAGVVTGVVLGTRPHGPCSALSVDLCSMNILHF